LLPFPTDEEALPLVLGTARKSKRSLAVTSGLFKDNKDYLNFVFIQI
jgi:hypothetical protein